MKLATHDPIRNGYGYSAFPLILLLILFITAVGISGYLYYVKEKTTQYYTEKVEGLNKKILSLNEQAKTAELESRELRSTVAQYENDLASLKQKQTEQEQVIKQLQEIKQSLSEHIEKLYEMVSKGFGKVDDYSLTLDTKLASYLKDKQLQEVVKKDVSASPPAEESVELPKLVVKPEETETTSGIAASTVASENNKTSTEKNVAVQRADVDEAQRVMDADTIKVMKVNQEHRFLIINKGMIDGVKVGSPIDIYRKDIKVAEAIITEVRELLSLAMIQQQFENHFVEEGDTAKFK